MQRWEELVYAREEGSSRTRTELIIKNVEAVMRNFHVDLQRACEGIGTTVEEYYKAKNSI